MRFPRAEGGGGHLKRVPGSRPQWIVAVLAFLTIIVATLNLKIPYFALRPGPAEDVSSLITIDGVETSRVRGKLLLTTVRLYPIVVGDAILGWFDSTITIVSRAVIIPTGESEETVQRRTTEQMEESQLVAAAAALELLGYEVPREYAGVRIEDVLQGAPAAGVLRPGDVIVEADGKPVRETDDLVSELRRHTVGQEVKLRVERDGEPVEVTVGTMGRPDDPDDPIIGVSITDVPQVRLPLAIEIDSRGIGGPSAGLMFAVGIVDLIDQRDLTRGRTVAGTGEINLQGMVGPVGGIRQKVESARRSGASLFLVPADELKEACTVAGDLLVAGVTDLREAVDVLGAETTPSDKVCQK